LIIIITTTRRRRRPLTITTMSLPITITSVWKTLYDFITDFEFYLTRCKG
jgi:hypothetical protein